MKNKFIKILLIGFISITSISAGQYLNCDEAYEKLNKHNKRASLFMNAKEWEIANFYVEKIKDDYRYFYANKCFTTVFEKANVDKMRIKYKKNIRDIIEMSEMLKETLIEKERLEKEKSFRESEEKRKSEREKLKEELRAEIRAEKSNTGGSSVETYKTGDILDDNSDIVNDKDAFMKEYMKSKGENVKVIDSVR